MTSRHGGFDHHAARNLISLKTAAKLVEVNAKTIRNWIDSGDLQGFRLNGHLWRVNQDELLALARPLSLDQGGAA